MHGWNIFPTLKVLKNKMLCCDSCETRGTIGISNHSSHCLKYIVEDVHKSEITQLAARDKIPTFSFSLRFPRIKQVLDVSLSGDALPDI